MAARAVTPRVRLAVSEIRRVAFPPVDEPAHTRHGSDASFGQVRGQTPDVAEQGATRWALAAFLVFGTFWGAWAALVPAVREATGASNGRLGLALLFLGLGSLPAMVGVGAAIDRFGPIVLPAALVVMAATAVLPALATSVATLAAALFVLGAATGATDVAINAEVAALEAAQRRTLMPLAHGLFSLGVIVGAVAAGLARQGGATRLEILAGGSVLFAAAAYANRRPYPRTPERRAGRRIRPALVALGAVCALAFLVEGAIEGWSALFLERTHGAPPAVSALGPGAYALAMVGGRLSGRRLLRRHAPRRLLTAGGVLALLALVGVSRSPDAALAILAFAAAGAGISLAAPILFGAAGRGASDADRGAALATVTTIGYLGFLAGPPLVGGAADAFDLRVSFLVLAGAAAIVAAAAPRLRLG
jgi:predicted MFS family arabinose efflux permease